MVHNLFIFSIKNTTVTATTYQQLIRDHMLNALTEERIIENRMYSFIYDNARVHTGRDSIDIVIGNGIDSLFWPARSPDLSPVENCIAVVKKKVWERQNEYGNNLDLFKVFCANINSYRRRIL
eukprot:NODE_223_length_12360_cov_0.266862.p8 type:complete len:123 gc:universal NODE_223_length_12360_cov_0.266862:10942-11310(+)